MNGNLVTRIAEILVKRPEIYDYLNWVEISKLPMNVNELREWQDHVNWDIVSQYQPLSLDITNEFDRYLRYDLVSKNRNVDPEVLKTKIDRMDFDTVQKYQIFNADLIKHFWEQIDPKIIMKYQTDLPEEIIYDIIERMVPVMVDVNELKSYMRIVLQYQTVSEAFIRNFMSPRSEAPDARMTALLHSFSTEETGHIVDLNLVLTCQQVSEDFLNEFVVNDEKLMGIAVKTQKLSMQFINKNISTLSTRKVLKHQTLTADFIKKELDSIMHTMNVKQTLETVSRVLNYQEVDFETCDLVIGKMRNVLQKSGYSERKINNIIYDSWMLVFLRLNSGGGERFNDFRSLKWKSKYRTKVRSRLNWTRIAKNTLSLGHVERCLTRYIKNVPLYTFLKHNAITEELARKLDASEHLGVMEWWVLLTQDNKRAEADRLPESFRKAHADRLLWWKYVDTSVIAQFYQDCLHVIEMDADGSEDENVPEADSDLDENASVSFSEADVHASKTRKVYRYDLKRFLNDFVSDADWAQILRYEKLEEWFIRLFANFSDSIDMFWWKVTRYQKLSMKFIAKYISQMDVNIVLGYQKLEDSMIRTLVPFLEEDGWDKVARYQPISPEFINEYSHMLPDSALRKNMHVM